MPAPVVVEYTYQAPVEKVWEAITSTACMKKWYFDIAAFKAEVGFRFSFTGGNEDRSYLHVCTITEVIPFKKLAYNWQYEGYEGNSLVTFSLFDEGEKTRLKLTHEGLETFPAANADFAKANFEAGWNYIIGTSLKSFVEK